jgi:PAS domain S-box-containing protein
MSRLESSEKSKDDQIARLKEKILKLRKRHRELKAREESSMKKIATYRDIFDTIHEGIVYTTLNGTVISINHALEQILEISREKTIGKNIVTVASELLQPAEAKSVVSLLRSVIGGKEIKSFQIAYKDKLLEVSASINLKTRNLTGTVWDITDRKKIDEQLLRKNKDLSRLFSMSLQLLESIDSRKVLPKIAEYAADLVGTDTSAIYLLKGDNVLLEVTSPPLPENFPDEFRIARLRNHPHIEEVIHTRTMVIITDVSKVKLSEEEKLIVETRNLGSLVYIPLFVQQKVEGVIILGTIGRKHVFEQHEIDLFNTFSNITSLTLENAYLFENLKITKDKAEESNRLKTAFLHNISHEIRTPLNAIIGFSSFLGRQDITPAMRNEYLNIISQSNNQLLSIIDDILNISHIEADQVVIHKTIVDAQVILQNLYRQYDPVAAKKGLDFRLHVPYSGPDAVIMTDDNKIIAIVTNLLNNAFKFTHEGSVELGSTLSGDFIEFYVSDTGIGIPEEEHARIFDRFYQIDKTTAKLYGGMGLGLSISAAYAKLIGGHISLDSSPGKGSRFTLSVPYSKAETILPPTDLQKPVGKNTPLSGRTILIAEDEDSNYAYIGELLKSLGYKTLRAYNGLDVIDICSANSDIDLILMDIRLPLKDGYESASEIHKFRPHLPIIAQTSYGFPDDLGTAIEKGFIDYITKPFSREQLTLLLDKYLK